jgi:rare lipoprotein A
MAPYQVNGVWYYPRFQPDYDRTGYASWYGAQYHYHRTSDGELFDMDQASGAHTTLPLPCIVEVTNLDNGRRVQLRINDRGPFVQGRILDVSRQAARDLGFYERGMARVRVRYLGPAPLVTAQTSPPPQPWPQPEFLPHSATAAPPGAGGQPVGLVSVATGAARVQAGAFADRANAERAAALFAQAGGASLLPLDREGVRLWRVVISGQAGESPAALRQRVVAAGFPQARALTPGS